MLCTTVNAILYIPFIPIRFRYILIANEKRGHYVHFMNLDRPGLFPDQKILLATVTDVESERVERLTDAQVKSEVHEILRQAYANATQPSGNTIASFCFVVISSKPVFYC